MQRVCFVLQVRPERLEEYKERHRSVWPEMQAALRETGWGNYSLFLRDDGLLVGYLETENFERARSGMAKRRATTRCSCETMAFSSAIWRQKTLNVLDPGWPSAKSTSAGSARWVTFSFSLTAYCPISPCSRC